MLHTHRKRFVKIALTIAAISTYIENATTSYRCFVSPYFNLKNFVKKKERKGKIQGILFLKIVLVFSLHFSNLFVFMVVEFIFTLQRYE
jgi:hypothetical protein